MVPPAPHELDRADLRRGDGAGNGDFSEERKDDIVHQGFDGVGLRRAELPERAIEKFER